MYCYVLEKMLRNQFVLVGARGRTYGICYSWVHGGWDSDALGFVFSAAVVITAVAHAIYVAFAGVCFAHAEVFCQVWSVFCPRWSLLPML